MFTGKNYLPKNELQSLKRFHLIELTVQPCPEHCLARNTAPHGYFRNVREARSWVNSVKNAMREGSEAEETLELVQLSPEQLNELPVELYLDYRILAAFPGAKYVSCETVDGNKVYKLYRRDSKLIRTVNIFAPDEEVSLFEEFMDYNVGEGVRDNEVEFFALAAHEEFLNFTKETAHGES